MNVKKNILFFVGGFTVFVIGIGLVLTFWQDVVSVFRGMVGIVLALAGILILVLVKD
ncbi:MAG: hypothetical protein WC676_02670 [Candidatus Omnitrophota bacterium]